MDRISALMDGELSAEGVVSTLERMERHPSDQARWQRYCLIRDVMAKEPLLLPRCDMAARVMLAIQEEGTVTVRASDFRRNGHSPRFLRWPSLGLAASVLVGLSIAGFWMSHDRSTSQETSLNIAQNAASSSRDKGLAGVRSGSRSAAFIATQSLSPNSQLWVSRQSPPQWGTLSHGHTLYASLE